MVDGLLAASHFSIPSWVITPALIALGGWAMSRVLHSVVNSAKEWAKVWFESIMREVTPNGGNTNSLGDTAKRTEEAIKAHAALDLVVQAKQERDIKRLRREYREHRRQLIRVLEALATHGKDSIGVSIERADARQISDDAAFKVPNR